MRPAPSFLDRLAASLPSVAACVLCLGLALPSAAQDEHAAEVSWGGSIELDGADSSQRDFSGEGTASETFVLSYDRSDDNRTDEAEVKVTVTTEANGLSVQGTLRTEVTGSVANVNRWLSGGVDLDLSFNPPDDGEYVGSFSGQITVTGYEPENDIDGDTFDLLLEIDYDDADDDVVESECPQGPGTTPCLGTTVSLAGSNAEDFYASADYRFDRALQKEDGAQSVSVTVIVTASGAYVPVNENKDAQLTEITTLAAAPYLPGDVLPIAWSSTAVDDVRLLFTEHDEPGAVYTEIAQVGAGSGTYAWTIPDGTLCYRCRLVVQDAGDETISDTTAVFRIKGYELTRVTADERYERFDPVEDGWSFANEEDALWPESWWQQFDYFGTDVNTGQPYPAHWSLAPILAKPSDFPDWALFNSTYGNEQTYYLDAEEDPVAYRPLAVELWSAYKEAWDGSCTGLSVGALLGFAHEEGFGDIWPTVGPFGAIGIHPISNARRAAINQFWMAQTDERFADEATALYGQGAFAALAQVQQMLLGDAPPADLLLFDATGGHSVVPYRIDYDEALPDDPFYKIYVYDPNLPGDTTVYVGIDLTQTPARWSYTPLDFINLEDGIYLGAKPALDYLTTPELSKRARRAAHPPLYSTDATRTTVYAPAGTVLTITDAQGRQLGSDGTAAVGALDGARPIIPITGRRHAPIGYALPRDAYRITVGTFPEAASRLSVVDTTNAYIYYRRGDPLPVAITLDDGLTVTNTSSEAHAFGLRTIEERREDARVFAVTDVMQQPGDSLRVRTLPGGHLQVAGSTEGGSYTVTAERHSGAGVVTWRGTEPILLAPGVTHTLRPAWETPEAAIEVDLDTDGDGETDETIVVAVESSTGTSAGAPGEVPQAVALYPNYPNPFNPTTQIRYALTETGPVTLVVYDALGREVRRLVDGVQAAGWHTATFDATGLPSGVYLYRLQAAGVVQSRTMLLVK